jgi:hypothetical protein
MVRLFVAVPALLVIADGNDECGCGSLRAVHQAADSDLAFGLRVGAHRAGRDVEQIVDLDDVALEHVLLLEEPPLGLADGERERRLVDHVAFHQDPQVRAYVVGATRE